MMVSRNVCVFVLVGLVLTASCRKKKSSAPPATQSITAAAALARMKSLMEGPRASSQDQFLAAMKERLPKALEVLAEMEQKYPKAEELHEARLMGVIAANQLARMGNDPVMAGRVKDLAGKILASDAPSQFKLTADAHLLLLKIKPLEAPITPTTTPATTLAAKPPAAYTAKTISQFVQRYAGTDQAVGAIEFGLQIARNVNNNKAFEQLVQRLAKDHPDDPRAKLILRQMGQGPDVGKPFAAEVTKLNGTKLTLPDDLLGKVVVIDFWAVWCRPCIATIPHMKSLYAKYKPQGVEFVGISLDENKYQLKAFVDTNRMGWIHTYSGKGWSDPTIRKYGVRGIPSIWVVGKDGKVVSDNARGNLAATIEKAL